MQSIMNSFADNEATGKRCSGPSSATMTDLSVDMTHHLHEMPSASERSLPYNTSGNLTSNPDEPPAAHPALDSIVLRATPGEEYAEGGTNTSRSIIGPFLRRVESGPACLTRPMQQLQMHSWLPQDTTPQEPSEMSLQTEERLTMEAATPTLATETQMRTGEWQQNYNNSNNNSEAAQLAGGVPRETGNDAVRHIDPSANTALDFAMHHPMPAIAFADSRNHSTHSDAFPGSYSTSAAQNMSMNAHNTSGSQAPNTTAATPARPSLSYTSAGQMMMMAATSTTNTAAAAGTSANEPSLMPQASAQTNTSLDQSPTSHEMAGLMAPGTSMTHPMGFSITSSLFETSCSLPPTTLTHPAPLTALTNMRSNASNNNNNNNTITTTTTTTTTVNNRSSGYTNNNNNDNNNTAASSGAMGFGSETALPQYTSYTSNINHTNSASTTAMPFGSLPRSTTNSLLVNAALPATAATLLPAGTTAMMMMAAPEARLSSPTLLTTMNSNNNNYNNSSSTANNNNNNTNMNTGSSGSNGTSLAGISPQSPNLVLEGNANSNNSNNNNTTLTAAAAAGASSTTQAEHSLTAGPNGHVPEDVFRSNLFVCGLSPEVRDEQLRQLFQRYGEIESAKVMLDIHTGRSRCIAFVKFKDAQSASQALKELNGSVVYGHPITVREANSRAAYLPGNPTNKTFVRNVPPSVTKEALHAYFSQFGEVIDISIHSDTAAHRSSTSNPMLGGSMSLAGASFSLTNTTTTTSTNNNNNSSGYAIPNGLLPPPPPPPPPPPMPLSTMEVRRNIVFITFATMEAAALAAEKTHTTMPFPECEGVPLLAKVAEDSLRRTERLARRLRSSLTSATHSNPSVGPYFAPPPEMCGAMPGPFDGRMYAPMLTTAGPTSTATPVTTPPNTGLFELYTFPPPPPPAMPSSANNNNNNGSAAAAGPFASPALLYAAASAAATSKPAPSAGMPFMAAANTAGPMLYAADTIGLAPPPSAAQMQPAPQPAPMLLFTGPAPSASPPGPGPQAMPILYTTTAAAAAAQGTLPTVSTAAGPMSSSRSTPPGTQATLLPPPPPPGMPTMMPGAAPTLLAFPGGQAAPYYVVMNGY